MNKFLELNPDNYGRARSFWIKLLQLSTNVYIKFVRDAGFARAGILAYNTLLAAIPFAALVISLMNAFGALDSVQDQIMDFIVHILIPTRQAEVKAIFDQFLEGSNTLGVVGLVFFAFTSIMLLNSVSKNLNAVWGSKVKTNFINKFTTYASVIIFGSLLLAASTTLTSRFSFMENENVAVIGIIIMRFAPYIFDFFVIMLIIGLTPSGKIQLRYLLLVSFVGAILWELLKYGFFNLSGRVLRMSIIYGSIAIIPIFLFWIYVIWTIIIIAMETAWVLQHKHKAWMGTTLTEMSPDQRLIFGTELFMLVAEAYDIGEKPPAIVRLAVKLSVSVSDVREMADVLISKNLLMTTGDDGQSLLPARSLSKIKTVDLISAVYGRGKNHEPVSKIVSQIELFYGAGIKAIETGSVADLLTEQPE
ncbi:MAG TPA: hypothetical protein DCO79_11000 [Spirochaeta sp.]|nr:hypothetical protein [Spirochaeta sp.]